MGTFYPLWRHVALPYRTYGMVTSLQLAHYTVPYLHLAYQSAPTQYVIPGVLGTTVLHDPGNGQENTCLLDSAVHSKTVSGGANGRLPGHGPAVV